MSNEQHSVRRYTRKCGTCGGTKEYISIQSFMGEELKTPVTCTYCDENGNVYDNGGVAHE